MKTFKFIWLIVLVFGLAACGGGEAPANGGNGGGAEATEAPTRPPRPTVPPTPVPGTFSFEVSGADDVMITSEEANRTRFVAAPATSSGQGEDTPATYRFNITQGNKNLQIRWPQSFESGEHEVTETADGVFVYYTPDGGARPTEFINDVSGTMTINIEDGILSGSIEFEASARVEVDGVEETQTVTVSGTFEGWELPTE